MGKSTGQLEPQRWDQVDLSAQGKSPAPWLLLAVSIHFFCACVLASPLTLPTPPLPHGPLQVGVTPALSFECWIELKRVNWWGFFAGFLSLVSPTCLLFFLLWFLYRTLQKVHCYGSISTAGLPHKVPLFFIFTLLLGHFSHQCKFWLPSLY